MDDSRNIYLIYAASYDKEFDQEIQALLQDKPHSAYTYSFDQKSIFTPKSATTPSIEGVEDIARICRISSVDMATIEGQHDVARVGRITLVEVFAIVGVEDITRLGRVPLVEVLALECVEYIA